MLSDAVVSILSAMGVLRIPEHKDRFVISCPLAKWTHASGVDRHPSCSIYQKGRAIFVNCYSCKHNSTFAGFVWRYSRFSGIKFDPFQVKIATFVASTPEQRSENRRKRLQDIVTMDTGPKEVAGVWFSPLVLLGTDYTKVGRMEESVLDPYRELPPAALRYLHSTKRDLVDVAIQEWELGWDDDDRRIVIPIRDVKGNLAGYSRKAIDAGSDLPWLHSEGFKKEFYLYGEHKIDLNYKTAILVEGFFDVIHLWQSGYVNALGIMGTALNRPQREKLVMFFDRVLLALDPDKAGILATQQIRDQLYGRVELEEVELPYGKDPDQIRTKALRTKLFGPPQATCLTPDLTDSKVIFDFFEEVAEEVGAPVAPTVIPMVVEPIEVPQVNEVFMSNSSGWTPKTGASNRPLPKPGGGGGPFRNWKPGGIPLWIWDRDPFDFKMPRGMPPTEKDPTPAPATRDFVFIDRTCAGVRRHQGNLLKQTLKGETFSRFGAFLTCLSEAGIEENKRDCCLEANKKPKEEKQMDDLKYASWRGHYTIIPLYPVEIGEKTFHYEPMLYSGPSATITLLEQASAESKGIFEGFRCTAKRGHEQTSSTVGESFVFGKRIDMTKIFNSMTWANFPLADLYDAAEKHKEHMEGLCRLFAVEKDANGKLVRKPPMFNYAHLLRPLEPKDVRQILGIDPFEAPKAESKPAPKEVVSTNEFDADESDSVEPASTGNRPVATGGSDDDDIPF